MRLRCLIRRNNMIGFPTEIVLYDEDGRRFEAVLKSEAERMIRFALLIGFTAGVACSLFIVLFVRG
jgi:hypothetical protein